MKKATGVLPYAASPTQSWDQFETAAGAVRSTRVKDAVHDLRSSLGRYRHEPTARDLQKLTRAYAHIG